MPIAGVYYQRKTYEGVMGKTNEERKQYLIEIKNPNGKPERRIVCEVSNNMLCWQLKHIRSVGVQSFFHDDKTIRFEQKVEYESFHLDEIIRIDGIEYRAGKGSDGVWYISKIVHGYNYAWMLIEG